MEVLFDSAAIDVYRYEGSAGRDASPRMDAKQL